MQILGDGNLIIQMDIRKMNSFIPFSISEIDNDEIFEVIDTLRSGWITSGPKTKQF